MRGNEKVIEQLNLALSGELSAVVQYMVQAEMCQNWGYVRLGNLTKARAIEEMKHAEGLIERILFLDGEPKVQVALAPEIGGTVQKQLENGLHDEVATIHQYNAAIGICDAQKDNGSCELFKKMVQDEERHTDFLEAQLHSIKEMGIANYLSEQLKES
jgi:bacterioferritin